MVAKQSNSTKTFGKVKKFDLTCLYMIIQHTTILLKTLLVSFRPGGLEHISCPQLIFFSRYVLFKSRNEKNNGSIQSLNFFFAKLGAIE